MQHQFLLCTVWLEQKLSHFESCFFWMFGVIRKQVFCSSSISLCKRADLWDKLPDPASVSVLVRLTWWTSLCVVVARADSDIPFCDLTWFCASLNKKKEKRLRLQGEKIHHTSWFPVCCVCVCVCVYFYFFILFPELCSGAISHFNKKISELFLTASLFYFPQEHETCVENRNCPWLSLFIY